MEQNKRKCKQCGSFLASDNKSNLCAPCQRARREKEPYINSESYDEQYYTLEQMRQLLGLSSYEQARRKAHNGEIPGRLPGRRQHLFYKKTIDKWLQEGANDVETFKLSDEAINTLVKAREGINTLEDRLPFIRVVENFEKQLPLHEVAKGLLYFIQTAPPPPVVISDIVKVLAKK